MEEPVECLEAVLYFEEDQPQTEKPYPDWVKAMVGSGWMVGFVTGDDARNTV